MNVTRRTLMGGAAALAASPANATLNLIFTQPILSVGTRQFSVPNALVVDTTNNSLNSRMTCLAPTNGQITAIVLTFPGFGFNNPEVTLPTGYTVTAAIEYPAGVFHPVTRNANRTLNVTPTEATYSFDPVLISIPPGATFWVKCFAQWTVGTFWLCGVCASLIVGDWTIRGTGLSDLTLSAAVQTTTTTTAGFGPSVYASFTSPQTAVGIIGDSIGYSGNDASDPVSCARFMERAMRNVLPIMNLARSGDTFTDYLANPAGRALLLSGRINRLICELGTNDTFAGTTPTLAAMQALATAAWAPFLAAGVKVWQSTLTPRTTSTDGWSTTANQTIVSAAAEALRQSFNAWIIASWATLGLSGYLDYGHAVDPTDSGVWNADGTTGTSAAGFCNLVGGSVSGCTLAQYNIGTSNGLSYPNSTTVACTVRGYPGETGTLPTITAQTGGTGLVTGFTIISPGANLLYPPMVAPNGAWTVDGTHPNPRGYNECIYRSGLSPAMLA